MIRILGCITDQHEPWLVGLAAIICAFGCFTTLSVLARARAEGKALDGRWLGASALTGGATIWTTHFVAMLAFHPGFVLGYDVPITAMSILFAVTITWFGFATALRVSPMIGGALFGAAVGAMHYTGMAALSAPAHFHWDGPYVLISIATGIAFGAVALHVFATRTRLRWRLLATLLMTFAIAGHHFTAMSALTLQLDPAVRVTSDAVMAPAWLAIAVAAVMVVVAGIGLAGSVFDQHLAQRSANEAARLRAYIEELEATKTDLNRALREAAAASEAKSRFLAAMSHELRTPLNAIIGFSDIMRQEMFGAHADPRYRDYAEDVNRSGDLLLRLINDILDFSKIDAGHFQLAETVFDPLAAVTDTVRAMRILAASADIALSVEPAGDLPLLRGDERRVRQILTNLLSNAIKFTPPRGTVRVTLRGVDNEFAIAVADNGIGIAAENIARAFEPFGQIDSRLARKYDGAGLGLPLSRQLMELHGGTLDIASDVDVGTIVTMQFPPGRIVAAPEAAAIADFIAAA
ncbi:MAG: MHYT domain-containing protein [Stellaceae bacterium]